MTLSQERRAKRKKRDRFKISTISDRLRLSVFRSSRNIYAQVIDDSLSRTIASASTLDPEIRVKNKSSCNVGFAEKVGQLIANRAASKGVTKVVFDKSGYKYHGIIKALAEAARSELDF